MKIIPSKDVHARIYPRKVPCPCGIWVEIQDITVDGAALGNTRAADERTSITTGVVANPRLIEAVKRAAVLPRNRPRSHWHERSTSRSGFDTSSFLPWPRIFRGSFHVPHLFSYTTRIQQNDPCYALVDLEPISWGGLQAQYDDLAHSDCYCLKLGGLGF